MPCYHPLDAWIHRYKKTDSGKNLLLFNYNTKFCSQPTPDMQVPCGRCVGCRLAKSREWAARAVHEASLYWDNCWLTLTLNDEYMYSRPNPYSLQAGQYSEVTKFLKRLRKKYGSGIRYLYCGEYGETCFFCNKSEKFCSCGNYYPWRGRPHYHMCLFNHDFSDKRFFKSINGSNHYNSDELDALWTDPDTGIYMGHATISDLTADSAAYTARYAMKKITGDKSLEEDPVTGLRHYQRLSPDGEIVDILPEFIKMSSGCKKLNTGGIGKGWLDKYSKEVLDNDSVLFKELRIKPPKYYDKKMALLSPEIFEENKDIRIDKAKNSLDNTPERLEVRKYITEQRIKNLPRKEN